MSKGTILVVDDDPDTVEAIKMILESGGYAVVTALDAEEATLRVQDAKPDLVLLDVMMPEGTEGFHFVWNLRNSFPPEVAETPIVILSAIHSTTDLRLYPDQSDGTYEPGEFLPVQGFIDKPPDPDGLLKKVADVLAVHRESAA